MRSRSNSLFSHPSYRYAELQNGNLRSAFDDHHRPALNTCNIKSDLYKSILKITMRIEAVYPELSKYIEEIPLFLPEADQCEINIQNLNDYYQSLDTMLRYYSLFHDSSK